MKKIKDASELKAAFEKASDEFGLLFAPKSYRITAEHFFIAGYEAAIAERAKFDEENGLIVKDLCNTDLPQD
jgi:hypothetical protein